MLVKTLHIICLGLFISCSLQGCSNTKKEETQLFQTSRNNMIFVPGGSFSMGIVDYQGQTYDQGAHTVNLSSYYISKDNVSYGEYDIYTQATDQPYVDNDLRKIKYFGRAANFPVPTITWNQANNYCGWLAQKTGLPYALPTEAEWEYAARDRGNINWAFPTDDGTQKLGVNFPSDEQIDNQPGNSFGDVIALPIGSKPCTPMGICGLAGAVNQWVSNWMGPYPSTSVTNPQGPATGTAKVIRGYPAGGDPNYSNSFGRQSGYPNSDSAGFRCVINIETPPGQLGVFASGYPK